MKELLMKYQLVAVFFLLSITSCGHGQVPRWDGKIWAGDSARQGITRAQANEHIDAKDAAFDDYAAMTYADMRKLFAIIQSCKQWPQGMQMMPASEALDRLKILMTDLERESVSRGR